MDARWMLVALLTTACGPSEPAGLVLEGVLTLDDMCIVTADLPLRAEGVLDTTALPGALRPGGMAYAAAFRLRNYESHPSVYPETAIPHGLELRQVEVEIRHGGSVLSLDGLPNPFLVSAIGLVPWAPRGDSSIGVASATVLPAAYGAAIDAALGGEGDIELAMHALATSEVDGSMRTSTTLVFPLRFCLGCLVTCAPAGVAEQLSCLPTQDEPSTVHCE